MTAKQPRVPRHGVLIANIGNSDVRFDVSDDGRPDSFLYPTAARDHDGPKRLEAFLHEAGFPEASARNYRSLTAGLRSYLALSGWETGDIRRVCLTILSPAIERAQRIFAQSPASFSRIILVATAQDERLPHAANDTVEAAFIAQEVLSRSWVGAAKPAIRVELIRAEPHRTDVAFAFYKTLFEKLAQEYSSESIGCVVAIISGGTPALNTALGDHVLARFGKNGHLLTVAAPPAELLHGEAVTLDTWDIRRAALLREVRALAGKHEYGALRELLQEALTSAELKKAHSVRQLIEHGISRFGGRYEAAISFLSGSEADKLRKSLRAQSLADIADAAYICWQRDDLLAFVARAGSLCDAARSRIIEVLYPGMEMASGIERRQLVEWYPEAAALFGAEDFRRGPGRKAMILKTSKAIHESLRRLALERSTSEDVMRVNRVTDALKKLRPLEEMRNAALHELATCTRAELRKRLGNQLAHRLVHELVSATIALDPDGEEVDLHPFQSLSEDIVRRLSLL